MISSCRTCLTSRWSLAFIQGRASSTSAKATKSKDSKEVRHELPKKMRSWQLNSYSGISGLALNNEAPLPVITQAQDLLINVKAASINPLDILMASGYGFSIFEIMQSGKIENFRKESPFPLTLGRDFSGVVVDKGMAATGFEIGDHVWGSLWPSSQGSHADYVLASNISIAKKPERLSHVEAASIPYAGLTGWAAVVSTGNLTSTSSPKKVLVVGASGGVGTIILQLLQAWNHEVTVVSRAETLPLMEKLGADRVLDFTHTDFLSHLNSCDKFDLILDFSGGGNDSIYLPQLKKNCGSKYVSTSSPLLKAMDKKGILFGTFESAMKLINKNLTSIRDQSATYRWAYYTPNPSALKEFSNLADEGKIVPVIEKVYSMENIKDAFEHLKKGRVSGKIVIEM